MFANTAPGVQDTLDPDAPYPVVHDAFNVDADVVVEVCTSNDAATVLPSASDTVVNNRGVESVVNQYVDPLRGSTYVDAGGASNVGVAAAFGARLYVNVRYGSFAVSTEENFFHAALSDSDADNRNQPVVYAFAAHACTRLVTGTDTRPAAHEEE